MRTRSKFIAVFSILSALMITATGAACAGKKSKEPSGTYSAEFIAEGKLLYDAHCALCHGSDARGTRKIDEDTARPVEIVKKQVRIGYDGMPAFDASQITDEQLEQIAAYLESLWLTR